MRGFTFIAACLLLTACTHAADDTGNITLQAALEDAVHSVNKVREEQRDKPKVGMYLDSTVIAFNVSAKRSNSATGQLQLSGVPVGAGGGVLGASASDTLTTEATRGNTVTLTFKNAATLDKGGQGGGAKQGQNGASGQSGQAAGNAGGAGGPVIIFSQPVSGLDIAKILEMKPEDRAKQAQMLEDYAKQLRKN